GRDRDAAACNQTRPGCAWAGHRWVWAPAQEAWWAEPGWVPGSGGWWAAGRGWPAGDRSCPAARLASPQLAWRMTAAVAGRPTSAATGECGGVETPPGWTWWAWPPAFVPVSPAGRDAPTAAECW